MGIAFCHFLPYHGLLEPWFFRHIQFTTLHSPRVTVGGVDWNGGIGYCVQRFCVGRWKVQEIDSGDGAPIHMSLTPLNFTLRSD